MIRKIRTDLFLGVLLGAMSPGTAVVGFAGEPLRPNIVIIMADDLGYGDLGGVWGGKARTPHLDQMARDGLRFTDFHSNGPVCTPTRASLMTGRYPQRLGIVKAFNSRRGDGSWENLGIAAGHNKSEITLATYLGNAGYATGIFGKWHLGKDVSANPVRHGFDEFRGLTCGCGDYYSKMTRYGEPDWWHNEKLEFQEGYATTVTADNAVRFIERQAGRRFFAYVPFSAIHFPWQGPEDGTLATRQEGHVVDKPGQVGKVGPHETAAEVPAVARRMIEEMDAGVGRILSALRRLGLERDTFVVFMSDNGGYNNYPYKGVRTPISSNGPLRGGKGQVYEGGHRVPAIAWWPGRIAGGRVTTQTAITMDLVPTALQLARVPLPAPAGPNRLDGVSLASLLLHDEPLAPRTLFWHSPPGRETGISKGVRQGSWKLVDNALYNLADDLGETRDRAAQRPDLVRELKRKLVAWENDVMRPKATGPDLTATTSR